MRWLGPAMMALALVACDGDADADAGRPMFACEPAGLSCDDTEYCEREASNCRGPGRCLPRPDTCTEPIRTVCGCDGQTYDSACEAHRAGTWIASDGPC